MRNSLGMLFVVFLFLGGISFAQTQDLLDRVDALDEIENHVGARDLLTSALGRASNNGDRAEIAWRLSRATLSWGDQLKDEGAPNRQLLDVYAEGEGYADQAIAADPQNPLGYYWKSSNIGRWGQTRGVLDSLSKAPGMRDLLIRAIEMDPTHADSYYVLGQLYSAVPGVISFGNKDYAVSLSRYAVLLNEAEVAAGIEDEPSYGFYLKLAEHLADRNWNAARRNREQERKGTRYQRATTSLERGWFYEGSLRISNQSDEDEARQIVTTLIGQLNRLRNRTPSENRTLREAQELLEDL